MWFLLVSCKTLISHKPGIATEIQGVKIFISFPHQIKDNHYYNWEDSLIVYLYGDHVIFEDEIRIQNFLLSYQNSDTPKSTLVSKETRPVYILTKKGFDYGYFSDSGKIRKVRMDTVVQNNFMMNLSAIFRQTVETNGMYAGSEEKSNGELVAKYIPKSKPDKSYADTTYLFYTDDPEMMALDYKLSEKLDKQKNKKLYKIHSLYLGDPAAENKIYQIQRDAIFRFKKITVEQDGKIKELFDKFIPMLQN